MFNRKIAAAALVAALPLGTVAATAGAANAAPAPQSKITVHVLGKQQTVAHVFGVRGKLVVKGKPAKDTLVKIQAQRKDGSWRQIKGAQKLTTDTGKYRIGVVINHAGLKHLRAVGVQEGNTPNVRQAFTVKVTR
jgi:hypothetical protein